MPIFSPKDRPRGRKPKPPAGSPAAILQELRKIERLAERLQEEDSYGVLHDMAYTQLDGRVEANLPRGHHTAVRDPTGDTVASERKESWRRALVTAEENIQISLRALRAVNRTLALALGMRPPGKLPHWW